MSAYDLAVNVVLLLAAGGAMFVGVPQLLGIIRRQEQLYDRVLRTGLLMDISPRRVTVLSGVVVIFFAMLGYLITDSVVGGFLAAVGSAFLPTWFVRWLKGRRVKKLEEQLVLGIQTLASGVRAGLNLVQSMALIAHDGAIPLRQEFAHLMREYEYGVPLEEAMENCATRVGSGDFRLLFAALHTHRERGGDLGETLDRIAESIREIQRLESRVQTLTAQGRANARWLSILVIVALVILYLLDSSGVTVLFTENVGKCILGFVVLLNVIGFVWIRWIINIDI